MYSNPYVAMLTLCSRRGALRYHSAINNCFLLYVRHCVHAAGGKKHYTCTLEPLGHQSPHEAGAVFTPVRPPKGVDLGGERERERLISNRET